MRKYLYCNRKKENCFNMTRMTADPFFRASLSSKKSLRARNFCATIVHRDSDTTHWRESAKKIRHVRHIVSKQSRPLLPSVNKDSETMHSRRKIGSPLIPQSLLKTILGLSWQTQTPFTLRLSHSFNKKRNISVRKSERRRSYIREYIN